MPSHPTTAPPTLDLSKIRIYTVSEANALIPRLEVAVQKMQELIDEVTFAHEQLHDLVKVYGPEVRSGDHAHHEEIHKFRDTEDSGRMQLLKLIRELREEGVEVKDVTTGLMDVYALRENQIVNLCWRTGEKEFGHWHTLEGGFSARVPIQAEDFLGE